MSRCLSVIDQVRLQRIKEDAANAHVGSRASYSDMRFMLELVGCMDDALDKWEAIAESPAQAAEMQRALLVADSTLTSVLAGMQNVVEMAASVTESLEKSSCV